jgi:hypothetical protein
LKGEGSIHYYENNLQVSCAVHSQVDGISYVQSLWGLARVSYNRTSFFLAQHRSNYVFFF